MRTLPPKMVQALIPFAPLFSKRVWQHAQVLLVGAILAPGKRTVASALRAIGITPNWRTVFAYATATSSIVACS